VSTCAQPNDSTRPLGAFADLVPLLIQLPGALGCSPEALESLRLLTSQPPNVSLPIPTSPVIEAIDLAMTRSIIDLIEAIASEGLLVLVIEDAHWLDKASLQL